jgi:predicted helicase
MFTYFLLKKMQESGGKLTYKELSEYLDQKLSINSIKINNKEQNPQTNISPNVKSSWENWKFDK